MTWNNVCFKKTGTKRSSVLLLHFFPVFLKQTLFLKLAIFHHEKIIWFKKSPSLHGARRKRVWHYHGSDRSTFHRAILVHTVFPRIVSAETIFFWKLKCGNYSKEETINLLFFVSLQYLNSSRTYFRFCFTIVFNC